MLIETVQGIAAASAIFLATLYLVGGLIVNLNMARRGVIEFEILRTKYLVVGLVFVLHAIGVFTFAAVPTFGLLLLSDNLIALQVINLISMISASSLLVIWSRYPSNTKSRLTNWWFWFSASAIGAIFPMLIFLRQILSPRFDALWLIFTFQALLTGALTFLAEAYHYSAFYYGRTHGTGALDPIGVGIPIRIRLGCEKTSDELLNGLGIPTQNGITTDHLYLVEETSNHYIVSMERVASNTGCTFKIEKSVIKAIQYYPDYTKSFANETSLPLSTDPLSQRKGK